MDFKATSTDAKPLNRRSGIGMVEFLVAMAIGSLLILTIMAVFSFSSRSFTALGNYSDLDQYSRTALDTMTREIRASGGVYTWGNNSMLAYTNLVYLTNRDGALIYYWWDPSRKAVFRYRSSPFEYGVLLTNCDYLKFEYFQRTPNTNFDNFSVVSTNLTANCKLIQMSWICSRTILGQKLNTESVQSAKVVIRNQ